MQFTGQLNTNEFYNALFNAYRLVTTFADGISDMDDSIVNKFRIDGGNYGDQLVYTDTDIAKSRKWDPTDTNVLATEQKIKPEQQVIVVSQFRQVAITMDEYLTRRAWMEPGAFNTFNSVVQAQVGNTKKVYDMLMICSHIGTMEAAMPSGKGSGQAQIVNIKDTDNESMRVRKVGRKLTQVLTRVKFPSRNFNDYAFMKAYKKDNLIIVWNDDYLSEFEIMDLPVIFHDSGIINFEGETFPGEFFGTRITATNYSTYSDSTPAAGKPIDADDGTYVPGLNHANGTLRALDEMDITVSAVTYHVMPGEELPAGAVVYASSEIKIPCYIEDRSIICKIMHKNSIKYPSGFETSTEFFNGKNLSTNRYLTWLYDFPEYLNNYPFITFREEVEVSGGD